MKVPAGVLFLVLATATIGMAQEVVLPLDRYDQLRHEAAWQPTPTPAPKFPLPWAVAEDEIEMTVGPKSARIRQKLQLTVFEAGAQEIPLPAVGRLLKSDLDASRGRITAGKDQWILHTKHTGRDRLELVSVLPVNRAPSAARPTWWVELPLPAVASVKIRVSHSPEMSTMEVVRGGVARRAADGSVLVLGKPSSTLRLRFLGATTAPVPERQALFVPVSTFTLTTLTPTRTKVRSWVEVRRLSGRLETLTLGVPPGMIVVSVSGTSLAAWHQDGATLSLSLEDPEIDYGQFEVALSGPAVEEITTPVVVPRGLQVRTIAAAVTASNDGILEILDPATGHLASASERASMPSDFVEETGAPMVIGDPAVPPRWRVTRAQGTKVLACQIDRMVMDVLVGRNGTMALRCWASTRTTGATAVTLRLPPSSTIMEARRDGFPILPGLSHDQVSIPLVAREAAQVVHLAALVPVTWEAGVLTIPVPAANAPIGRVEIRLVLPPGFRYELPADKTLDGSITLPKGGSPWYARGEPSRLLLEMAGVPQVEDRVTAGFFSQPPGYSVLQAGWNTLSAEPGELRIQTVPSRHRKEWF